MIAIILLVIFKLSNCLLIQLNSNTSHMATKGDKIEFICPLSINHSSYLLSWYKNEHKLSSALSNNRFKIESNKIEINRFLKIDSGLYRCQLVTGNGLVIQSGSVNLLSNIESTSTIFAPITKKIVGQKPQFINFYEFIENQHEQTSLQLDCLSTGYPKPNVLWYKNGRVISEEEYGIVRNLMLFKFNKLYSTDSGEYRCHVYNQFGEINRYFRLNVIGTEKISVDHNANLEFNCSDESEWFVKYKNREYLTNNKIRIGLDDYYLISSIPSRRLIINQASFSNSGLYVCANDGKVMSSVFDLDVHGSLTTRYDLNRPAHFSQLNIHNDYPMPVLIIIVLSIFSLIVIVALIMYYFVKLRKSDKDDFDESVKVSIERPSVANDEINYFEMKRFSVYPSLSNVPTYWRPQQMFRSQMIKPTQSTPQYFQGVQRQDLAYNNYNNSIIMCNNATCQFARNNSTNKSNSYRSCSKF